MFLQRLRLIFPALALVSSTLFPCALYAQQTSDIDTAPVLDDGVKIQEGTPPASLDVSSSIEELSSDRRIQIDENNTKITIKCNVPDAEVFINGQFEGNTTLTLNGLPEGRYNLRIEKRGYEPRRYRIQVRRGQEETFYIELRKYSGLVTFYADPADAEIYIDGNRTFLTTLPVEEGRHTIEARKFGYTSKSAQIFIFKNTYQIISFTLPEAPFSMSDLKANRSAFNPELPGGLGKIEFTFQVTNRETGIFEITDQEGINIISNTLPVFTTWKQSVSWNGIMSDGKSAGDGIYTAKVTAGAQSLSQKFQVTRSIRMPFATITASGSGIGTLPAAFSYPKDTLALGINGGAVFAEKGKAFYGAPVNMSIAYTPLDFMEISAKGGIIAGHEGYSGTISGAAKFSFSHKGEACDFDWGFLLRAGGASKKPYEPYGADNGAGAGGGLILGIDSSRIYLGLSSEITYKTSTYETEDGHADSVWRNGLALQIKGERFAVGILGAINSSFGRTGLENDERTSNSPEWLRAIDSGFDISIRPFNQAVFINLRADIQIFNEQKYFKAEAGISTLF